MIAVHPQVPQLSLVRAIGLQARYRRSETALVHDDATVTFGSLWQSAGEAARGLVDAGVEPGTRVAVAMEPGPAYVATVLGVLLGGGTAVPVNTRLTPNEVADFLGPVQPALAVCSEEHLPRVGALGGRARSRGAGAVVVDGMGPCVPDGPPPTELPALVLGTGGTTGTPKGALFDHRALWVWAVSAAAHNDVRSADTELFVAPFYHGTLVTGLLTTLVMGGSVIIESRFDPERGADLIASGRVTRMLGAATVVERLLRAAQEVDTTAARLRYLQFGMSASRPGFAADIRAAFPTATVITGYGATEFGPVTRTYSWEFVRDGEPRGVGRPIAGVEITIEADGELRHDAGTEGEILVSSPWQMDRYLVASATVEEEARRGPYLRSGDIGSFDEDGYLRLTGRLKDSIRTGGENVYPNEVEAVLHGHPAVAECAVYGVPDPEWGERVEAVVVPGRPALDLADLDAHLRAALAGYKVPKRIRVVEEIPQTSNFKTDRRELRRLAESAEAMGS